MGRLLAAAAGRILSWAEGLRGVWKVQASLRANRHVLRSILSAQFIRGMLMIVPPDEAQGLTERSLPIARTRIWVVLKMDWILFDAFAIGELPEMMPSWSSTLIILHAFV